MAIETFLSNGPMSLDEIISAIRTQSLDDKEKPVFTDAEIKLALRQAIVNSYGKFFTSDTYDLSFVPGVFEYSLPMYVQRVTSIRRQPNGLESSAANTLTGRSAGVGVNYFRQLRNWSTNSLRFMRDYPASTMELWYERDVPVPIDSRQTSASHDEETTTLNLLDAAPQLYMVSLPTYFKWDDEIVLATAATGNTALTIARGQLGSAPQSHDDGSEISQLVVADATDRFYNFLWQEAGRLLNEFRVQAGNQSVSVAANITAARMFKENREAMLRQIPQQKQPRKMRLSRGRRPRRGVY